MLWVGEGTKIQKCCGGLTDLCGHDPLSLCDEVALAAGAVAEAAVPLVSLQPRDQPVVPAARALGAASVVAPAAAVVLLCKEETFRACFLVHKVNVNQRVNSFHTILARGTLLIVKGLKTGVRPALTWIVHPTQ